MLKNSYSIAIRKSLTLLSPPIPPIKHNPYFHRNADAKIKNFIPYFQIS